MLPGKQYTPGHLVDIVRRSKWLIAVPMVLGGYAALIVSSRLPTVYESEMLIQVVPQRVPDSYVQSTVTMRTEDRLSVLSEQIMSRTELERLIVQMDLYPDERRTKPMQDVVESMRESIHVDPVRAPGQTDAEAFYVRFRYDDAETSARVTERLGALFIEVNARDRTDLAQATNNFLQGQLAEAKMRLEEQELKLKRFREQNAGRLPTQLAFNMQAIQTIQLEAQALVEQLARDRDRKLMLERLYNDALAQPTVSRSAAQPPTNAEPTNPEAAAGGTPVQQLAMARDALARMELRLTAEHPDVVRTKRLIGELEAQVASAAKKPSTQDGDTPVRRDPSSNPVTDSTPDQIARRERINQMRAEIESLERQISFKEAQEERLRESLRDYQLRIEQVPGVESEWIALTRDYDTLQAAYKDLLSKSEDARVAGELEKRQIGEQFRILDPAHTPVRPTSIDRWQVNTAGTALGLGMGLALAVLREFLDRTLRSAEDLSLTFKLPVLAMVPRVMTQRDRRRAARRRLLTAAAASMAGITLSYFFWALELWRHVW